MPEAVIFTGLQASGKSTFYKSRFFQSHVRISLDLLRTRNREKKLIQYCLDTEMNFVIDNTNPTTIDRKRYFDFLKSTPQFDVTGYYFQSKFDECVFRNNERPLDEKVPEIGIRSIHSKLEVPTISEGYNSLWYIRILESGKFEVEPWSDEI